MPKCYWFEKDAIFIILDPNVDKVVLFPGIKRTRLLNDNQKHLISLEIGIVKMNRINSNSSNENSEGPTNEDGKKEKQGNTNIPSTIASIPTKVQKTVSHFVFDNGRDIYGSLYVKKTISSSTSPFECFVRLSIKISVFSTASKLEGCGNRKHISLLNDLNKTDSDW